MRDVVFCKNAEKNPTILPQNSLSYILEAKDPPVLTKRADPPHAILHYALQQK